LRPIRALFGERGGGGGGQKKVPEIRLRGREKRELFQKKEKAKR